MKINISKKLVLVDKKDWKSFQNLSWHIETGHGYVVMRDKNKHKFYLHRLIMDAKKGEIIDHINNNKLDNRRVNLRKSTQRQNILNQKEPKGVSFTPKGLWRAYVTISGKHKKQIHLGHYCERKDAVLASKIARIVLDKVYSEFDIHGQA